MAQYFLSMIIASALFLPATAFSNNSCKSLINQKRSSEKLSVELLRDLANRNFDLENDENLVMNQKQLQTWVDETNRLSEAYLNQAGIQFTKSTEILHQEIWPGRSFEGIINTLYELTAGSSQDYNSRMIKGFLIKTKNKIRIIYNPLYFFQQHLNAGEFNPSRGYLYIGYRGFLEPFTGTSFTLRHEIQHALEDQKLLNGERTLARFNFFGSLSDEPYSAFARLDELETFVRDYRQIKDPINASKLKLLKDSGVLEDSISALEDYRQKNKLTDLEILKSLLIKTEIVFNALKIELRKQNMISLVSLLRGTAMVEFSLENSLYTGVKVEVSGIDRNNDVKIQALHKVAEEIEWAEGRIKFIKAQIIAK